MLTTSNQYLQAVQEINDYVNQAKYRASVSVNSEIMKTNIFIGNVIIRNSEYKDIKELTRDVVVKLISEVRVSENKEIEIVFDFDDCYKQLLESVEKLGYQVDKEPDGQLNISRREAV